jgi:DnaK suppressor protein
MNLEEFMAHPYYDEKFLEQQKELLLQLKQETLNKLASQTEDLQVSPDQTVEDGDQAQTYLNQNVSFGLRERDMLRLREIEAALFRIDDGSYGICEETDEAIGEKRLQKMPWTRLSIGAAEQLERESSHKHRAV